MSKRLQVLLDEEEYLEIKGVARKQRLPVAEWVRQALRTARSDNPGIVDAKLRAIADMLKEIEAGHNTL